MTGRFAHVMVGDQLELIVRGGGRGGVWLVTDLWFDPVRGQTKEARGHMVAVQRVNSSTGEPVGSKFGYSRRGLAALGFRIADRDWAGFYKARFAAYQEGKVAPIRKPRPRPKGTIIYGG
jgi:hypothetical protein